MLLKLCLLMTVCVALTSATCSTFSTVLYRVVRPNENCNQGLLAKDPSARESLEDHVGIGSSPGYTSQYISTTTELSIATKWWKKNQNLKIVRISRNDVINAGCTVYDFNIESVKNRHLVSNKAKNFARALCEVTLECSRPLNCVDV